MGTESKAVTSRDLQEIYLVDSTLHIVSPVARLPDRSAISPSMLRVIRFKNTGARESHELAMCVPRADGSSVKLIYSDRETECVPEMIQTAVEVNVQTITKAYVLHTIMRDEKALRAKLGDDYEEVRRPADRPAVHVCHTERHMLRRIVRRRSSHTSTRACASRTRSGRRRSRNGRTAHRQRSTPPPRRASSTSLRRPVLTTMLGSAASRPTSSRIGRDTAAR